MFPCHSVFFSLTLLMHKNLYTLLCYEELPNYHEIILQYVGVLIEKNEYQRPKIHNSRRIAIKFSFLRFK